MTDLAPGQPNHEPEHQPSIAERSPTDVARTIAENATLGLVMMDARQHCTYLNTAAEQIFGFTLAEVLALDKPLHDIVHHQHPDGRPYPMADCPIDRALPERARTQGTDVFVHRDGHFYPVAFTASPILEGGVPVGTIIEVRDLSAERRVAAALRSSEDRYSFLAESIPVHVWTAEPDGNLDYVSERTARYFGVTSSRLLDEGWQSVIHEGDLDRVAAVWTRSLATGVPYEVEFRLRRHDGVYRWHLGRAVAQREDGGRVIKWFGTNLDVEDRKLIQEERDRAIVEIEIERRRLHNVLQQAPAVIGMYRGPDHVISMCNPLWERFTGRKDVLGKTFDEVFPEIVGSEPRLALDVARDTGKPIVGSEVLMPIDRDGSGVPEETYWNYVVQPIVDADGKVDALLAHAVEVTDVIRARRESEARAEELTRLGSALLRSNRDLDQFAYVASHDLKSPLRGIANLATWIEEDTKEQLSEESRGHLELLKGRVQRMEALIDGILTYSRADRTTGAVERVGLTQLVRDLVELVAPPPGVRMEIAPDMPEVESELVPLQQVLLNLVSNAVKYAGPQAQVKVVAHDDGGPFVEITVVDDGPGIDPEFHDRIWGIFQTLEARDDVEGTGIGLSVVRKVVEGRGGRTWIESQPGAGAAFHFTWPRTPAAREPETG